MAAVALGTALGAALVARASAARSGTGIKSLVPEATTFAIARGSNHPGIWAVLADGKALRLGGGFKLAGNPAARHAWFPLK